MFNYDKSDSEGWTHETTIKVAGVEFQFMKNDPRNDPDAYVSGSAWVPTPWTGSVSWCLCTGRIGQLTP